MVAALKGKRRSKSNRTAKAPANGLLDKTAQRTLTALLTNYVADYSDECQETAWQFIDAITSGELPADPAQSLETFIELIIHDDLDSNATAITAALRWYVSRMA